jgi:hypothetical protein
MKKPRALDIIAEDIHRLEKGSIIDVGLLLLEAKEQCGGYGKWLPWLELNGWSESTAQAKMQVARLVGKYPTVRDLKLAANTLYALAGDDADDADLPDIIKELCKHATKKRLSAPAAERPITIAVARKQHGNLPDATLVQLAELDLSDDWHADAIAALKKQKPTDDKAAELIVADVLFPPAKKHEPQEPEPEPEPVLQSELELNEESPPIDANALAERKAFKTAVRHLRVLSNRSLAAFANACSAKELRAAIDFLVKVEAEAGAVAAITKDAEQSQLTAIN